MLWLRQGITSILNWRPHALINHMLTISFPLLPHSRTHFMACIHGRGVSRVGGGPRLPEVKEILCLQYMQYFKSWGAGVWFATAIAATLPHAFTSGKLTQPKWVTQPG